MSNCLTFANQFCIWLNYHLSPTWIFFETRGFPFLSYLFGWKGVWGRYHLTRFSTQPSPKNPMRPAPLRILQYSDHIVHRQSCLAWDRIGEFLGLSQHCLSKNPKPLKVATSTPWILWKKVGCHKKVNIWNMFANNMWSQLLHTVNWSWFVQFPTL